MSDEDYDKLFPVLQVMGLSPIRVTEVEREEKSRS